MTLKELSQLYYLNHEIEMDKERLAELRQKAYSLSGSTISGMPRGGNNSRGAAYEKYAAEIADLEAIISAKITQCLHERSRLERYISEISNCLTRQIFTYRFVSCLNWNEVADKLDDGTGRITDNSVKKRLYRYLEKN